MKRASVIFVFISTLLTANCALAGPTKVILKAKVNVEDMVVRLKDIASISGDNKAVIAALGKTIIASSPLPGSVKEINRYSISKYVARRYKPIIFSGADRVAVTIKHTTYLAKYYLSFAKDKAVQKLGDNYRDIELTPIGIYRDLEVPVGDLRLSLESVRGMISNSRMEVTLRVFLDNEFYTQLPIWFKVEGKIRVYVSNKGIHKYQNITPDMVSTKLVSVSSLKGKPIACENVLGQYISTESINPGKVLTMNNTEHNKLIVRGQDVQVTSKAGAITISVVATALEAGRKGDFIKLRNKSSNKVFVGEITGAHSARSL